MSPPTSPSPPNNPDHDLTPSPPPKLLSSGNTLPIALTLWWSSRPPISRALYQKAASGNPSLTPLERLYLLSRLDLSGIALAHPESISEDQRNFLPGRPPPTILTANIRRYFQANDDQRELTTVAEVVEEFQDGEQLVELGYEGLECISLNWWRIVQDRGAMPWDDWGFGEEDKGSQAAGELLQRMRPAEVAFEDAAREMWMGSGMVGDGQGEGEEEGEEVEEEEVLVGRCVAEAGRLRGVLIGEVKSTLEALSDGDRMELERIRERMVVEVERDGEEDRKSKEEEREERKRKAEEEVEEKRRKRAWKAGDDEEDSDEEGYVLWELVFDD